MGFGAVEVSIGGFQFRARTGWATSPTVSLSGTFVKKVRMAAKIMREAEMT
jgi:hypothetical protein